MGSERFVPTHVLVSEEGEAFELVRSLDGSYVDFVTYHTGGRAIFPSELEAVGTTARELTEEERASYEKLAEATEEALHEVRELTEKLEVARKRHLRLNAKLSSATEAVSS